MNSFTTRTDATSATRDRPHAVVHGTWMTVKTTRPLCSSRGLPALVKIPDAGVPKLPLASLSGGVLVRLSTTARRHPILGSELGTPVVPSTLVNARGNDVWRTTLICGVFSTPKRRV
jgi:hypothetical protein